MEEKKEKMITLDSVSLVLPLFALKRKEVEGEIRIIQAFDRILGKREVIKFDWLKGIKGLKALVIDWDTGRAKFQFSAKILGKDYFNLINKNNIEQVFEIINSLNIGIEFYTDRVLEYGEVVNCDFTANLRVKENVRKYIFDLYMEAKKYSKRFFIKIYQGSVVFEEAKKTKPLRFIAYDKYSEMLRRKENDLGIEKFRNVLRFEINAKRKKNVRDLAGVETNRLWDILNSQANPFLTVFEKLFRNKVEQILNEKSIVRGLRKRDIRRYYEAKGVIHAFEALEDYKSILVFEGGYSESNARKVLRDLLRVLKIEPKENRRMKELYELIKKTA
jgi:hypothetical protein